MLVKISNEETLKLDKVKNYKANYSILILLNFLDKFIITVLDISKDIK